MSSSRGRLTSEFRAEGVRLVKETGCPIAHVAAEVGIGAQLLGRWVTQAKPADAGGRALDIDERAELERLRAENAGLRLDRSLLKIAAKFAVDPRGEAGSRSGIPHDLRSAAATFPQSSAQPEAPKSDGG